MTDMTKDIVGRLADAMVAHVQQVLHDYGIPDDTIRNDPEIASATREAVSSALESLSPPDGVMDAASPVRERIFGAVRAFTAATVAESQDATTAIMRIINNSQPYPLQPKCQHCNDTGLVAIRSDTGIYARPGPVPCDARGYAEAPCWECSTYPGGFDGPTGAD